MEWVPMLDHQMQCSPNSFSGFVFLQNAKLQNCKNAKLHLAAPGARLTPCGHIWSVRGAWNQDRLFHLKTLTIVPFLPLARLSLMSPDRGRWSIFNPTPAFIQTLPRKLCLTKCTHLKSSTAYSLYQAASYKSVRFFSLLPRNRETQKYRNSLI